MTGCAAGRYHKFGPEKARGLTEAPSGAAVPGEERMSWPLRGEPVRPDPSDSPGVPIRGVVIRSLVEDQVAAARGGQVVWIRDQFLEYGKTVLLEHAGGVSTIYAGLAAVEVREGQKVRQGQRIARAARSQGQPFYRLYFEVRENLTATDPMDSLEGTSRGFEA